MFDDPLPEVLPLVFPQLGVTHKHFSGGAVGHALPQHLLILDQELRPLEELSSLETLQHLPTQYPV